MNKISNIDLKSGTETTGKPVRTPVPSHLAIESLDLFQGHQKIIIIHQGQEYTLQVTRQGKLLLTK
ncbi:hemin uptake protein HemP [Nitrospira sp. M1]